MLLVGLKNSFLPVLLAATGLVCLALAIVARISKKVLLSGGQVKLFITAGIVLLAFSVGLLLVPSQANRLRENTTPTILGVTIRKGSENGELVFSQEINFYDEDGNTNAVEWKLIDLSDASQRQFIYLQDGQVEAPPELQKIRATVIQAWHCDGHVYVATLEVSLVDADGQRSQPVRYRIDCE